MDHHRVERGGTVGLVLLGVALAAVVFQIVYTQPAPLFHPWRDAELRATYDTFLTEGVPLIKVEGSGSPGTQLKTPTGLAPAAFDDDPGVYLVASYLGRAIGADEPYAAVTLIQALLAALPWVWLPLTIGRLFGRAAVGVSAVLLMPLLSWIAGQDVLLGTDYGLVGRYVQNPVYALYGAAGSLVFLSLTLLLLTSTLRRGKTLLWTAAVAVGLLAGMANLMRAASGVPVMVAGVCVLLFLSRGRWVQRIGVVAVIVLMAWSFQALTMHVVNDQRSEATGLNVGELPIAHGTWHSAYVGLGYIGYDPEGDHNENPFGIVWSDQFAYDKAREVDPDVIVGSSEYDRIMRGHYFDAVRAHPAAAVRTYFAKLASVIQQQGFLLVPVALLWALAFRLKRYRYSLLLCALVGLPAASFGLIPPLLALPMRFYFVESTAGLAILYVGAVGWATAILLPARREGSSVASVVLSGSDLDGRRGLEFSAGGST